jgi:ribosomal protein S18 acetylase RimI-like enzyme
MKIRRARLRDAEQVAKLYLQFWEVHKDRNPLHQPYWKINYKNCLKDTKDFLKNKEYKDYQFRVAVVENKVVGFILFTIKKLSSTFYKVTKYGYIEEVAVDKAYRRRGIAKKLLESALDYFKKKNLKYVSCKVELDNIPALKTWEKYGFKQETIELVKKLK